MLLSPDHEPSSAGGTRGVVRGNRHGHEGDWRETSDAVHCRCGQHQDGKGGWWFENSMVIGEEPLIPLLCFRCL